jgi:hypothetical protein
MRTAFLSIAAVLLFGFELARADPPVASYIFPPGGQRGKTVDLRVGGLNLHKSCSFEMLGKGVKASRQLKSTKTIWFEGPILPLPESQQQEDYPKDMAGRVKITADAPLGVRHWRLWNAQGATPAMKFIVGDLPEIVEQEIDGDPVPVEVQLPVTINGRIFPRENVDIWSVTARKGQTIACEVNAARLGSPLDSRLEVRDPRGQVIAENDDYFGADSFLRFTAPADGKYQVRIHDINYRGGQAYVYRLTLTADPYVDRVYPLGGRRGGKVKLELSGQGLPKKPVEIALPASAPSAYTHRLSIGGKLTNPVLLDLDDLPEHLKGEAGDDAKGKLVSLPAVLNGRIDKPGMVDSWAVTMRKGDVYEFDLRAGRLGSPLKGVLTIRDAAGKQLARSDGSAGQADPFLRFSAPADGTYQVRVEDYFRSRGGPAFAYRFRIGKPASPGFRLQLGVDVLAVNRGGQVRLRVTAERQGNFRDAIPLQIDSLPEGVTAKGTAIPANQGAVEITFQAARTAPIRGSRLTIRGSGKIAGKTITQTAHLPAAWGTPAVDSVLLAVVLPTPFKVVGKYDMGWAPRGTFHQRHYRIERGGFKGPIRVQLADRQARHLQGVTGPTITVPAGESEFTYAVYLPSWMETARTSRTCVMAVGVIKDADGTEHTVCHSSVQPNEQVVVVIEPGRLEVELGRQTLAVAAGKAVALPVKVGRGKSLKGPVKVELVVPAHLRGVTAEAVTIAADRSSGTLTLRVAPGVKGPFNMPLTVRATVMEANKPVVGEARLKLRPELPGDLPQEGGRGAKRQD